MVRMKPPAMSRPAIFQRFSGPVVVETYGISMRNPSIDLRAAPGGAALSSARGVLPRSQHSVDRAASHPEPSHASNITLAPALHWRESPRIAEPKRPHGFLARGSLSRLFRQVANQASRLAAPSS